MVGWYVRRDDAIHSRVGEAVAYVSVDIDVPDLAFAPGIFLLLSLHSSLYSAKVLNPHSIHIFHIHLLPDQCATE